MINFKIRKILILPLLFSLFLLEGCAFPFAEKKAEIELNSSLEDANSTQIESTEVVVSKDELDSPSEDNLEKFPITYRLVSWGHASSRKEATDTLVIHSSYNSLGGDEFSVEKIINIYKEYGVAPHYLISREGKVYQLVEDQNIAYHAGESSVPDGRKNVNAFSLGIEIINSKKISPSEEQYKTLNGLIAHLKKKYPIKYVLGHSHISPGRKDDPWKFDWDRLELKGN